VLVSTHQEEPHFSQFCATLFGIFYCGFLPAFWVKLRALAFVVRPTRVLQQGLGSRL